MRFNCHFVHHNTDERKSVVVSLTDRECESVEALRKHKGAEAADVTAAAYALHQAYREINPHAWRHIEVPQMIQPS